MDDLQAAQTLARYVSSKIPKEIFLRWLATGLALTHYGEKAFLPEPLDVGETWNWLGELFEPGVLEGPCHVLDLPGGEKCWPLLDEEVGLDRFVQALHSFGPDTWEPGDPGRVAWKLLQEGFGKSTDRSPTLKDWRVLRSTLRLADERLQEVLGSDPAWSTLAFEPPIDQAVYDRRWTHEEAAKVLDRILVPEADYTLRVGLLAWARMATSYGHINGRQTHNWGMIGKRVSEGESAPEGHILDETGTFAVKVYPTAQEGIEAFLERIAPIVHSTHGDIGLLADRMLEHRAWGYAVPRNRDKWLESCGRLRIAIREIEDVTGMNGGWVANEMPDQYREATTNAKEDKRWNWKWIAGGATVLLGGAGLLLYSWRKKKSGEGDTPDTSTVEASGEEVSATKDNPLPDEMSDEEAASIASVLDLDDDESPASDHPAKGTSKGPDDDEDEEDEEDDDEDEDEDEEDDETIEAEEDDAA